MGIVDNIRNIPVLTLDFAEGADTERFAQAILPEDYRNVIHFCL
jgi:hypothetical protein